MRRIITIYWYSLKIAWHLTGIANQSGTAHAVRVAQRFDLEQTLWDTLRLTVAVGLWLTGVAIGVATGNYFEIVLGTSIGIAGLMVFWVERGWA